MTGRSTGAEEMAANAALAVSTDEYRRHSIANIDNIENEMNKQTSEIQDIMRHSIASNYSFHSKVSLKLFHMKVILPNITRKCVCLFFLHLALE